MKSGACGVGGRSAPSRATCCAVGRGLASASTSPRRTPRHRALPTAPCAHWMPDARGWWNERPLPAHSSSTSWVTIGSRLSSSSPSTIGLSTSPSMRSDHRAASTVGASRLLRTKKTSSGVWYETRSSSLASRLIGRGLRTISLSLPGIGAACAPAIPGRNVETTTAAPVAMRKPLRDVMTHPLVHRDCDASGPGMPPASGDRR